MAYWIGVVGNRDAVERLRTEKETWWCAPKDAVPGDMLAMYVARTRLPDLPESLGGIGTVFEILGPEPSRAAECRSFGGFGGSGIPSPVRIKLVKLYAAALKLADMKLDPELSRASFVRRSFQGTCFSASEIQFKRIEQLLNERSPKQTTSKVKAKVRS